MADYSSIYPWIRKCLRDVVNGVEDSEFDLDIKSIARETLSQFHVAYDDLVAGDDKDRVDEVVGLRVAAASFGEWTTGGLGMAVTAHKTDDMDRKFDGWEKLIEGWLARANEALTGCTFYTGSPAGDGPRFAAGGPRRSGYYRCSGCP